LKTYVCSFKKAEAKTGKARLKLNALLVEKTGPMEEIVLDNVGTGFYKRILPQGSDWERIIYESATRVKTTPVRKYKW
jgi:hypothetical protein